MRNLPTVAIGLGLLLAAILLDQRTAEDRKVQKRAPDWAPSSWPPSTGPPPPEWWPTGTVGEYAGRQYALLTLRATLWIWEIDYETGALYKYTRYSGVTHRNVLVGPGVNIGSENDPDPADPWVTNRQTIYNIRDDGRRVDIAQFVSAYGNTFDGVGVGLQAPTWTPVSRPYRPFPVQPPMPFPGQRPVPDPLPLPAQPAPPIPAPMAPPRVAPGVPVPLPVPAQVPTVAPRPLPRPVPRPAPRSMPRPLPIPVPSRTLLPNGMPAPALPAPTAMTAPWQEVPWPGGPVIGSPAQRPPATPEGIANELGRLESKLAALGGRPGLDLEPLAELIRSLLPGPAEYTFPAGRYLMYPVCEFDNNGEPLRPREAPWPAGKGELKELRLRLDALAELLQAHKFTRQPVCPLPRSLPPAGQAVTVTFEQEEIN